MVQFTMPTFRRLTEHVQTIGSRRNDIINTTQASA